MRFFFKYSWFKLVESVQFREKDDHEIMIENIE